MQIKHLISLVRKLTKLTVAGTLLLKAVHKLLDMALNYIQIIFLPHEQALLDPQI